MVLPSSHFSSERLILPSPQTAGMLAPASQMLPSQGGRTGTSLGAMMISGKSMPPEPPFDASAPASALAAPPAPALPARPSGASGLHAAAAAKDAHARDATILHTS